MTEHVNTKNAHSLHAPLPLAQVVLTFLFFVFGAAGALSYARNLASPYFFTGTQAHMMASLAALFVHGLCAAGVLTVFGFALAGRSRDWFETLATAACVAPMVFVNAFGYLNGYWVWST